MSSTKLLLFSLLLANFFNLKALIAHNHVISVESITLSKKTNSQTHKKIHLKIKRLYNPDGEPIIISHAFMLNNHAYKRLSKELWKKGFDVWLPNMRGHGIGTEKTMVTPYELGDYSFDHIITEDWPILIEYIKKKTKKKFTSLGTQ